MIASYQVRVIRRIGFQPNAAFRGKLVFCGTIQIFIAVCYIFRYLLRIAVCSVPDCHHFPCNTTTMTCSFELLGPSPIQLCTELQGSCTKILCYQYSNSTPGLKAFGFHYQHCTVSCNCGQFALCSHLTLGCYLNAD